MDGIRLFALLGVQRMPKQLDRDENSFHYQCECPMPLPKCIVVFTQGNWKQYTEDTVIDISFMEGATVIKKLGSLSASSRCFHWEKDSFPEEEQLFQTTRRLRLFMELKGELLSRKACLKSEKKTDINDNEHTQDNLEQPQKSEKSPAENHKNMPRQSKEERKRKTSKTELSPSSEATPQKRKMTRSRSTRTIQDIWQNKDEKDVKDEVDGCLEKPSVVSWIEGKENVPIAHPNTPTHSKTAKPTVPVVPNETIRGKVRPINYKRGSHPTHRWGHTLCLIHEDRALLIGGQGDRQQMCKDAVWIFDVDTKKWTADTPVSEGQRPELRMGHTSTFDPTVRCVYVYGGSKNKKWFHDVHMLDLDEWKWQLVKATGKAPTRAYHSATLFRHELWIFGGIYPRPDPQPDASSNEINIFSPLTESWYSPIVNGAKPAPRSGHSATVIGDQLVIFGGWDFPVCFNDLYVLDMSIVEWTKPECNGNPPSPRSWHSATQLTGDRILFHAGYSGDVALDDTHMFKLDTKTWYTIVCDQAMSPRTGHTALCLPYKHENRKKDDIVVFGGGDNEGGYYGNLVELRVSFDPNEPESPEKTDMNASVLSTSCFSTPVTPMNKPKKSMKK